MPSEYYPVDDARSIAGPDEFRLPRASALAAAVRQHDDFDLIECLAREHNGELVAEFLVVDVRCDAVPANNRHGIGFPERFALGISKDPLQAVEVSALRKDFPRLMHQNYTPEATAASLCLYYEPARAVRRTWTPQSLLKRIQLWLEKASRDELHAADQPAEQLFFVTPYELVLPWNFEQLRQSSDAHFHVVAGPERPEAGRTYFLLPNAQTVRPPGAVTPIVLRLAPVQHGRVEVDPRNLGGLADLFQARGENLLTKLSEAIQDQVGPTGVNTHDGGSFSVLLLEMPVTRELGGAIDHVFRRAFLLFTAPLELGAACGALMKQDNRYFREQLTGLLAAPPKTEWRELETLAMEVQQGIDRPAARQQSGIAEAGPAGVVIGAGALGSAVLDLWTRCGWGDWTVIDHDHIKPHNLVRHIVRSGQIGMSKAYAVANLHDAVMRGASGMKAIHADACELDVEVLSAVKAASLVVDASTTLDYPRLAASQNDVARHASIFVTPDANGAVLLVEDANRTHRLRTLEAQYYRALLTDDWGARHLAHHLGQYWSGASCRDISYVMPYSRILAHAAMLSEQVQATSRKSDAAIHVWERDPDAGTVTRYDVPVAAERSFQLDDLTLYIDGGLEEKLRAMRSASLPAETGGILLGYYDFNIQAVVVVDALPAPPDSRSTPGSFERGVEGVMASLTEAGQRTANIVRYLGEWHSHPKGHSAAPSRDDFYQLVYLATGMADEGLPALQLIVGEGDLFIVSMQAR